MNKCPCCGSEISDNDKPIISLDSNKLLASGEVIRLSPREAEIMSVLISKMPVPVHKELLLERIYGAVPIEDGENTLNVFLSRLRQKIRATTLEIRTLYGRRIALEYREAA